MSISTVGFSVWETLPAGTHVRLTLSAHQFYEWYTFPVGARKLYDKLLPVAHLIPATWLELLGSAQTAVIDARLEQKMTGTELLNTLESLGSLSAFVANVERLNPAQAKEIASDAGAKARAEVQENAEAEKDNSSAWAKLLAAFGTATTVVKYTALLAGVLGVAYVAHQFRRRA